MPDATAANATANPKRKPAVNPPEAAHLALPGLSIAEATDFDIAVGQWKSYEDVARWLKQNFVFDKSRLDLIISRTRQSGPAGPCAPKHFRGQDRLRPSTSVVSLLMWSESASSMCT